MNFEEYCKNTKFENNNINNVKKNNNQKTAKITEEELENFIESMSSIETPLILGASSFSLFEKAVALYAGRCIYDRECDFEDSQVENLRKKYGFIVL